MTDRIARGLAEADSTVARPARTVVARPRTLTVTAAARPLTVTAVSR